MQGWIQSSSSDLHKSLKFFPNLISQLFIAVDEINLPPCFIVYYEIKQLKDYSVDHTANPAQSEYEQWAPSGICSWQGPLLWNIFQNDLTYKIKSDSRELRNG